MAELRLGNIKPAGDDNVVVESKYVKGGYTVVATKQELFADPQEANSLNIKGANGKNIIDGSLCYCQEDKTFYQYTENQYTGGSWEPFKLSAATIQVNDSLTLEEVFTGAPEITIAESFTFADTASKVINFSITPPLFGKNSVTLKQDGSIVRSFSTDVKEQRIELNLNAGNYDYTLTATNPVSGASETVEFSVNVVALTAKLTVNSFANANAENAEIREVTVTPSTLSLGSGEATTFNLYYKFNDSDYGVTEISSGTPKPLALPSPASSKHTFTYYIEAVLDGLTIRSAEKTTVVYNLEDNEVYIALKNKPDSIVANTAWTLEVEYAYANLGSGTTIKLESTTPVTPAAPEGTTSTLGEITLVEGTEQKGTESFKIEAGTLAAWEGNNTLNFRICQGDDCLLSDSLNLTWRTAKASKTYVGNEADWEDNEDVTFSNLAGNIEFTTDEIDGGESQPVILFNRTGSATCKVFKEADLTELSEKGFSLEVLINSEFCGNLDSKSLTWGNIAEITYDKIKFSVLGEPLDNYNSSTDGGSVLVTEALFKNTETEGGVINRDWQHIVFVYEPTSADSDYVPRTLTDLQTYNFGATLRIYINGALCAAGKAILPPEDLSLPNTLTLNSTGADSYTGIRYLNSYVGALTAADVYSSYLGNLSAKQESVTARNNTDNLLQIWFVRQRSSNDAKSVTDGKKTFMKGACTFSELHGITKKKPESDSDTALTSKNSWATCKMYWRAAGAEKPIEFACNTRVFLQGTSTLAYPVKNYQIKPYTEEKENFEYSSCSLDGPSIGTDTKFTLKCDFMESSHRNNTPTAKYYQDKLLPAVVKALNPKEIDLNSYYSPAVQNGQRDAIDGVPCLVYYVDNEGVDLGETFLTSEDDINFLQNNSVFAGSYMFNVDKEGSQLGFKIKDKDDQSKTIPMVSYEGGTNNNGGAVAFRDYDNWFKNQYAATYPEKFDDVYDYILDTVEARSTTFNDDGEGETSLNRFKKLIEFLDDRTKNPFFNSSANIEDYKKAFKTQFSYEYCMAYYLMMQAFALVDSAGKNAMFDYWEVDKDNRKVYVRPYDMDTQMGISNFGDEDVSAGAIYHYLHELETLPKQLKLTISPNNLSNPSEGNYSVTAAVYNNNATSPEKSENYTLKNNLESTTTTSTKQPCLAFRAGNWSNLIACAGVGTVALSINEVLGVTHEYWQAAATYDSEKQEVTVTVPVLSEVLDKTRLPWSTSESLLWLTFEKLFAGDIKTTYQTLRTNNILDVSEIDMFIRGASSDQIGETFYNADAARRYLSFKSTASGGSSELSTQYLKNVQGPRHAKYFKFLEDRLAFLDTVYDYDGNTNGTWDVQMNSAIHDLDPKMKHPAYMRVNLDQGSLVTTTYLKKGIQNPRTISIQVPSANKNGTIRGLGNAFELSGLAAGGFSTLTPNGNTCLTTLNWNNSKSKLSLLSMFPNVTKISAASVSTEERTLELSRSTKLRELDLQGTTLTNLTLSNISDLAKLNLQDTSLEKLALKDNEYLILNETLELPKDSLTQLDIQNCSQLGAGSGILDFSGDEYSKLTSLCLKDNKTTKLTIQKFGSPASGKALKLDLTPSSKDDYLESLTLDSCYLDTANTTGAMIELDFSMYPNLKHLTLNKVTGTKPITLILPSNNSLETFILDYEAVTASTNGIYQIYTNDTESADRKTNVYAFKNAFTSDSGSERRISIQNTNHVTSIIDLQLNVTTLNYAFYNLTALESFKNCKLSGTIKEMVSAFRNLNVLQNLPTLDITYSNCSNYRYAFSGDYKLYPSFVLNQLEKITADLEDVETIETGVNLDRFMYGCGLRLDEKDTNSLDGTDRSYAIDMKYHIPKKAQNLSGCFSQTWLTAVKDTGDPPFTFTDVVNMSSMFARCSNLVSVPNNFLDRFPNVQDIKMLFFNCSKLTTGDSDRLISEGSEGLKSVITAAFAFAGCSSLAYWDSVNLISYLPKVEDLSGLYYGCSALSIPLSSNMFTQESLKYTEALFCKVKELVLPEDASAFPTVFKFKTEEQTITDPVTGEQIAVQLCQPPLASIAGMFAFTSLNTTEVNISLDSFFNSLNYLETPPEIGFKKSHEALEGTNYLYIPGLFMGATLGGSGLHMSLDIKALPAFNNLDCVFAAKDITRKTSKGDSSIFQIADSYYSSTHALSMKSIESPKLLMQLTNQDSQTLTATSTRYAFAGIQIFDLVNLIGIMSSDTEDCTGMFCDSSIFNTMGAGLAVEITDFSISKKTKLLYADHMFRNSNVTFTFNEEFSQAILPPSIKSASYMFAGCAGFTSLPKTSFEGCAALEDISYMFSDSGLKQLPQTTYKIVSTGKYSGDSGDTTVAGIISGILSDGTVSDKSEAIRGALTVQEDASIRSLFYNCTKLKNLEGTFSNCPSLSGLIPSNLFRFVKPSSQSNVKLKKLFAFHASTQPEYSRIPQSSLGYVKVDPGNPVKLNFSNTDFSSSSVEIELGYDSYFNLPVDAMENAEIEIEAKKGKNIVSIILPNNELVPDNWLKDFNYAQLDISYIFYNIGHSELDQVTKAGNLPSELGQQSKVLGQGCWISSAEFAFSKLGCIEFSDIDYNFLANAYNLTSIKGLFYDTTIGTSECFTKKSFGREKALELKDAQYAFLVENNTDAAKLWNLNGSGDAATSRCPSFFSELRKNFLSMAHPTYSNDLKYDNCFWLENFVDTWQSSTGPGVTDRLTSVVSNTSAATIKATIDKEITDNFEVLLPTISVPV